jgi:hypothetical protein
MSCFGSSPTLVSASWKSRASKHEPWNLNLETYHPSKHVKFWRAAQHAFQCWAARTLETYHPLKHVKFWRVAWHMFWCSGSPSPQNMSSPKHVKFGELCFNPMHQSSAFPNVIAIHVPWPIHDVLDLFQLSHGSSNFCWSILSRQLMKIME